MNDFSGGSVSFSEPQDRLLTAPQRPAAAAVAPVAPPWTLPEVGWGWKGVNFGSSRSNFLNDMAHGRHKSWGGWMSKIF